MAVVAGFAEPSKEELLARVARERAAWEELVAAAGDRLEEPGAAGDWTLRDVVAHVCAYQRFLVGHLGGAVRPVGEMPPEVGMDVAKRNAWMHERDRDRPVAEVLAEDAAVHRELVAQLEARSPEELRAPLVDFADWPVWRWVIHLTQEHYAEHVPPLRRFLGRAD